MVKVILSSSLALTPSEDYSFPPYVCEIGGDVELFEVCFDLFRGGGVVGAFRVGLRHQWRTSIVDQVIVIVGS